jgi:hypothetical protein
MNTGPRLGLLFRELGRFVVNFNSAEHSLRRLAFVLIDPAVERTGEITVDRLGADGLGDLVQALAHYRLGINSAIALRIDAAVKRFDAVRIRRNNFVHAIWIVPDDATDLSNMSGVHRKFRQDKDTSFGSNTPELVAQVNSELSAVWDELISLYDLTKSALQSPQIQ